MWHILIKCVIFCNEHIFMMVKNPSNFFEKSLLCIWKKLILYFGGFIGAVGWLSAFLNVLYEFFTCISGSGRDKLKKEKGGGRRKEKWEGLGGGERPLFMLAIKIMRKVKNSKWENPLNRNKKSPQPWDQKLQRIKQRKIFTHHFYFQPCLFI